LTNNNVDDAKGNANTLLTMGCAWGLKIKV